MSNEPIETKPRYETAKTDWFLQELVDIVNGLGDLEIGITLQVSGMLVSGNMVSGPKYFEGFAEDFSEAFGYKSDATESVKTALTKHGDIYPQRKESEEAPLPQYIHLKNARYFNTFGKPIPDEKAVW